MASLNSHSTAPFISSWTIYCTLLNFPHDEIKFRSGKIPVIDMYRYLMSFVEPVIWRCAFHLPIAGNVLFSFDMHQDILVGKYKIFNLKIRSKFNIFPCSFHQLICFDYMGIISRNIEPCSLLLKYYLVIVQISKC